MKIQIASDLHLDCHRYETFSELLPIERGTDVLILAGDLIDDVREPLLDSFLDYCRFYTPAIIYTPGNHEYLYGDPLPTLRKKDIIVLERSSIDLGIPFYGCTLWSHLPPMYKEDPNYYLHNYRHFRDLGWLSEQLTDKFQVVITHYAPLDKGTSDPKYESQPRNAYYANDLSYLLEKGSGVWIFGHTHLSTYQQKGGWLLVSNCLGYPGEQTNYGTTVIEL